MADRLLKQMIKFNIIECGDEEIYRFGLEGMILKLIHYTTYLLIAVFFRETIRFLIFFTAFLLLRKNAGGYHAKTKLGCYISSCATVLTAIIIMKFFSECEFVIIAESSLIIIADTLFCMMAPLGNKNRTLSEKEKNFFKKQSMSFLIVENVLLCVMIIGKKEAFAIPVGMAIICEAILLLLEKIRKENNKIEAT